LRELYLSETGFVPEVEIYTESFPEVADELESALLKQNTRIVRLEGDTQSE